MKADLAEKLLARVMGWEPGEVAVERPILQVFADLKYDEYQQFSPGMRFVESLALWLNQFKSKERKTAYEFIKSRLIFISHEEMAHFVEMAYSDFIRPLFLDQAARLANIPRHQVRRIKCSDQFVRIRDDSLFFGLSDGARIDMFRRSSPELSHEHIFQSYDIPFSKLPEEYSKVKEEHQIESTSENVVGGDDLVESSCPEAIKPLPAIVLIDDFSASGTSYFRKDSKNRFKGKIAKFLEKVECEDGWSSLVKMPDTMVVIVLYVATDDAVYQIQKLAAEMVGKNSMSNFHIRVIQRLSSGIKIERGSDIEFAQLAENYYDKRLEDEHTAKGGTEDLQFGYGGCGLPLVLHHNTPNNSLFLLWAEGQDLTVKGLFPRVRRHRSEK